MQRWVVAIGLLLGMVAILPAQNPVPLEWKLAKGNVFYLRSVSSTKQTLKRAGAEATQEVEQTTVLGFTVEEVTKETVILRQTVEGVSVKNGMGAPVNDERIAGASFLITLSLPRLEVLKFEGYDAFLTKLTGEDVGLRKTLQGLVTEEALKRSVREALAFLPDRQVKEGDAWQRVLETPFGPLGMMALTQSYKFDGKDDVGGKKVEKISINTSVEFKVGKADAAVPYHVVSGTLKVDDGRGTIHFDAATGRLVQSKTRLALTGRMILQSAGTNVETDIQQEQTTVVTLLNENPWKR